MTLNRLHRICSVGSLFAMGGLACNLALNFDEHVACTIDADCPYSDGEGQCVSGRCQPLEDASNTDPSGGANTEMGTEDESGPLPSCSVNTDCNDDELCRNSGCVSLISEDCPIVRFPDGADRNNLVFVGTILPTGGLFEQLILPLQNAAQLAFDDFNAATSLQGGRAVGWIGCDDTLGVTQSERAARHLVEQVGVPALIGPAFSESSKQVAENVTIPNGVFQISSATASVLSLLEDDNLYWRIMPTDLFQVNAFIDRTATLQPARLLVLYKDDAYGQGLYNDMLSGLVDGLPTTTIKFLSYDDPTMFGGDINALLASYGGVLGDALDEEGIAQTEDSYDNPSDHYTDILILGSSEAEALIISYLGIWAQSYRSFADLPRITLSNAAVPIMAQVVQNIGVTPGTEPLLPLKPLLFTKLEGIAPNVFDEDNFVAFNIRYRIAFMDQDALTTASLAYDSVMAPLLAASTIPADQPITGAGIAAGMPALNDSTGMPLSFGGSGLDFVLTARNALVSGRTLDVQGVSGALDWENDNGELRADLIGWGLGGTSDAPQLVPQRIYTLNDRPATDGQWAELE